MLTIMTSHSQDDLSASVRSLSSSEFGASVEQLELVEQDNQEVTWDNDDIGQAYLHDSLHADTSVSHNVQDSLARGRDAVYCNYRNPISTSFSRNDNSQNTEQLSGVVQRNEMHHSMGGEQQSRNLRQSCSSCSILPRREVANGAYSSMHNAVCGWSDVPVSEGSYSVKRSSSSKSSRSADSPPTESPILEHDQLTNQKILQDGLGLYLRDIPSNTVSSNQHVPHNWQANQPSVKSRLAYMLASGALADVEFVVGGSSLFSSCHQSVSGTPERFQAHKFVLSMGSSVFDAMFNGKMAASCDKAIQIPDVEPCAFRAMLAFLYTDEIMIGSDTVMSVLYAAKKYDVSPLEGACVEFLKDNISSDNAFMLLTQARLFDEAGLARMCLDAIDKNASEALASDGFTDIDKETLCLVLSRDTLGVRESKLFSAVTKWAECECVRKGLEINPTNQREVLGTALHMIRYPLMTVEEFSVQVAQTKILTDSELVELFLYFTINPKPLIGFTDIPRCCLTGKEQVVSRFCQVDHRWGYSGTSDRIKFIVTKKIYVAGFGVYGSVNGPAEYSATIEILSGDTQRVLNSTDTTFTCDSSSSTFRLMFSEPVEIAPCVHYYAAVTLKGPDSYYGTKGLRKVTHESAQSGKVSFQFSYAAGNNNGTSVEDGQIPEILFYT